jgi:hypothetical protein
MTPADTNRRLKIEALSWGAFFRNGGTPWRREFLAARRINPGEIHFWALDHFRLLEWPGLPRPIRKNGFFGR